jgi:iron(III) transport system substrate-binding protein
MLALTAFFCGSCKKDSAAPQRQVVIYCSVDQELAANLLAKFEKKTGIKVVAKYDSEDRKVVSLTQRLLAEKDAPAADVFWSGEVFHTIQLARQGVLAPYRSARTAGWPGRFADPQGLWYGFGCRARVIAYSTARVKPQDAPRKLEDLLDAKWKGRIVMANPAFGTTSDDVAGWFAHYGPARAEEILHGLKANEVRTCAGNSDAVSMVSNGRAAVALSDTDDVFSAQRENMPVAFNFLRQGDKGPLVFPTTAAIIRGAPHATEAAELMEFLLSDEMEQALIASDSHNTTVRGKGAPAEFAKYMIPIDDALPIDYAAIADQLDLAVRKSGEILR